MLRHHADVTCPACTTRCCCCSSALLLDALFGDMPALFRYVPHPVVLAGRAIALFERKLNRDAAQRAAPPRRAASSPSSCWSVRRRRSAGLLVERVCRGSLSAAWSRSLVDRRAAGAAQPLRPCRRGRRRRCATGRLAGRARGGPRTSSAATRRASTRTASPAPRSKAWPRISATASSRRCSGTLLLGLPGLFAYKMANTLDSMIGHRIAALSQLRLGGGAARRSAEPGAGAAQRRADRHRGGAVRRRRAAGATPCASCCATRASTARPMPAGRRRRWPARSASRSPGRATTPRAWSTTRGSATARARATPHRHRPRAAALSPSPALLLAGARCSAPGWRRMLTPLGVRRGGARGGEQRRRGRDGARDDRRGASSVASTRAS